MFGVEQLGFMDRVLGSRFQGLGITVWDVGFTF